MSTTNEFVVSAENTSYFPYDGRVSRSPAPIHIMDTGVIRTFWQKREKVLGQLWDFRQCCLTAFHFIVKAYNKNGCIQLGPLSPEQLEMAHESKHRPVISLVNLSAERAACRRLNWRLCLISWNGSPEVCIWNKVFNSSIFRFECAVVFALSCGLVACYDGPTGKTQCNTFAYFFHEGKTFRRSSSYNDRLARVLR